MRVAVGQAAPVTGDLAANVASAAALLEEAAARGARLLVLPEAFLTGYDPEVFAADLPREDELDGPPFAPLRDAAARTGATLLVSTPLDRRGLRRLSMLVATPDGRLVAAYDKRHLFEDETRHFTAGAAESAVVGIDGLRVGLSICFDGSFPAHLAASVAGGATVYAASAAYFTGGEERQRATYSARAVEGGVPVLLASALGRCGDRAFVGGSAIYDRSGAALVRLGAEPGVAVADLG